MTDPTTKPSRKSNEGSLRLCCLCLLCLLCAACTNKAVYHQYQAIDHFVWEKDREYYFTFMIDDAQAAYHLTFEVRNNNLYPYQNLWLFCAEEPPAGNIRRDTMECMLADAFGQWYGDGISLFQTGFPLRTAYRFPMPGQYTFSFRQGMRNDALQGIQEIGLRIEKAE